MLSISYLASSLSWHKVPRLWKAGWREFKGSVPNTGTMRELMVEKKIGFIAIENQLMAADPRSHGMSRAAV